MMAMLGGDKTLLNEFQRAVVRASCLEGEAYVVIDEDSMVTFSAWYGPGRALFDSYVMPMLRDLRHLH